MKMVLRIALRSLLIRWRTPTSRCIGPHRLRRRRGGGGLQWICRDTYVYGERPLLMRNLFSEIQGGGEDLEMNEIRVAND